MESERNKSKREKEKEKLQTRAEVGGTNDFVDIITQDPF